MLAIFSSVLAQGYTPFGGIFSLAIVFFVLALVAYLIGARGIAGMSAAIGRTLMVVFLVLAVVLMIVNFVPR